MPKKPATTQSRKKSAKSGASSRPKAVKKKVSSPAKGKRKSPVRAGHGQPAALKKGKSNMNWGSVQKVSFKSSGLLKVAATLTYATQIF